MMPYNVVLGTQIYNINVRSSKLIIESIAQKIMAFGHRFYGLKCFEVGFCFSQTH